MRTQLYSALKTALPFTLMASPLLMGSAQAAVQATAQTTSAYPTERSPYGANCNAETYEAAQLVNGGRSQRVDAVAHPSDASSHAIITSQQELSTLSRESLPTLSRARLYTAVRRLLLSNPYASDSADSEQAENNCIALLNLDVLVAQAADPLPILGPVNDSFDVPPASSSPASAPVALPVPASAPTAPAPASTQPASTQPASTQLFAPSFSLDPTNITPTRVNPTPFDGAPISTLSSRPDGNYRYVLGDAENRVFTDAALQQENVPVFVLRKEGNSVVGELMPRFGESGICVTGIVSGDSISGVAYPVSAARSLPSGSTVYGVLSLKSSPESADRTQANAVLDLARFSMINAGSSLPPKSCVADSAADD
ncbi:MAG: hypothetical protein AB8B99_21900 [Phormidesmis sp.]